MLDKARKDGDGPLLVVRISPRSLRRGDCFVVHQHGLLLLYEKWHFRIHFGMERAGCEGRLEELKELKE